MGAAALGIRNLLLLTGDDPKAGDQPDTKPVFDINSKTLIETARRLRDEGTLPTGRKVSGKAAFFIGAADMPIDPPAGWQPNALARQDQIRRAIRPDAVLHGCRDRAPLCRRARTGRHHATACHPHRRQSAALGQIGAMDEKPPFGTIIPDPLIARMEQAADAGARGHRICAELIEELFDHSRRRRGPHHGAGQ